MCMVCVCQVGVQEDKYVKKNMFNGIVMVVSFGCNAYMMVYNIINWWFDDNGDDNDDNDHDE